MHVLWYLALLSCLKIGFGQVTRKDHNILLRKKRYLSYPTGSNFVITMSYVKAVMVIAPKGINALGECDVPFPLPSDTRIFKRFKRAHYRHRRDILDRMENAFNELDLNGNACVKRMICEAQQFIPSRGKSLVKDLLSAIFLMPEIDELEGDKFQNYCHNTTFTDCSIPVINLIAASLGNY